MGKELPAITEELEQFIKSQHLFFVASAAKDGRVNMSPKGHQTFRVLSANQVAYLDLTGSGNETSAHLLDTNRITYMFVAFDGKPLILRLYGNGTVILPGSEQWDTYIQHFEHLPGARQIILSDIDLVKTSCGFSVPLYDYAGERSLLLDWAAKQGENGLTDYRQRKNIESMDGLPTPIGLRESKN